LGRRTISAVNETERERVLLERDALLRKLDEVKGLLARADARVKEDPENRRRWATVVENLEASLAELRVRLQRNELELKQAEGQLPSKLPVIGATLSDSSTNLLESVMHMSVSEVSGLTLEQAAQIEAECTNDMEVDPARRAQVLAHVELANQTPAAPTPEADEAEQAARRSQLVLRGAIDKIQKGRIDTMTMDEVRMTIACYDLIRRRVNPTVSDQRLTRILGAAINILNRKHAEYSKR